MSRKKLIAFVLCALMVGACLGAGVYAAVNYGTQDDPLITKSYVDNVLVPQLEKEFADRLEAEMPDSPENSGDFVLVTLSSGDKLSLSSGCELILREGSAMCTGSSAVMVDTTGGVSLQSGAYLLANHLYVVSVQDGGLKITGDSTKLLIKGEYSIG